MANVPRLSKILRGKETKPQTELESAIKYAIDNAGGGGGGSLPEPGTAGNVMTSTGTGWMSAAPQKGGVVVHLQEGDSGLESVEMTPAEIYDALSNGTPVSIAFDDAYWPIQNYDVRGDAIMLSTEPYMDVGTGGVEAVKIVHDQNGWDFAEASYAPVPRADASNNGQVLGVTNGGYALIDSKAPLIIHASNTFDINTLTGGITITDDITPADIYAAGEAGRCVAIETALIDAGNATRIPLAGRTLDNGAYEFAFTTFISLGSIAPFGALVVEFENATTGTMAVVTPQ